MQKPSSIVDATERWRRLNRSVVAILEKTFSINVLAQSERASNDLVRAPAVMAQWPCANASSHSRHWRVHLADRALPGGPGRERSQPAGHATAPPARGGLGRRGNVAADMPQLMGVEKRIRTPADRPQPEQTC